MASMRKIVLATTLLFCLSSSTSIRGLDLSKHLVIDNYSKQGFNEDSGATKSAGNSPGGGPIKAEDDTYTYVAGYQSRSTEWHGVRAEINIWKTPDIQPGSSSGAYISAISETTEKEIIAAGVHVNPGIYNDDNVHFFTFWTTQSDYSTGCYNNCCPGFVVANGSNLLPGEPFSPPYSTYGGEQRGVILRIKKDEKTLDWSLYREDLGGPIGGMTLLGWWPSSLFSSLSVEANIIQWNGIVTRNSSATSVPMGSGHFSSELEGKAASFNDCFGFDSFGIRDDDYEPITFVDRPDCYTVSEWYETKHGSARRHFFYGGPGNCVDV